MEFASFKTVLESVLLSQRRSPDAEAEPAASAPRAGLGMDPAADRDNSSADLFHLKLMERCRR